MGISMSELLTQAQMVRKLNDEIPKEQLPRSGKITTAYFSMQLRNGHFTHSDMKGKSKLYDWEVVAPVFGVNVKRKEETIERASEKAQEIAESLGADTGTDKILADFQATLTDRLSRALTSKQEIEIEKMSYETLTKQLEAQKLIGSLIDVDDAKATLEYILGSVKGKFYELPPKLKTRYPQLKDGDITDILAMVDDIFRDLSSGNVF